MKLNPDDDEFTSNTYDRSEIEWIEASYREDILDGMPNTEQEIEAMRKIGNWIKSRPSSDGTIASLDDWLDTGLFIRRLP